MSEILGNKKINSQFLGNKPIIRTYKGDELLNEYKPLYNPPSDWKDIRTDCPENSIALYAAHKADFSQYDNLGFTATATGGYKVFIDNEQYGSTYASGSQCNIIWSNLNLSTGDDITTPETLKAHKIWIEPATEGNNIIAFHCARVAASGYETQGLLWAHFNIKNAIECEYTYNRYGYYTNRNILAITALNNILKLSKFYLSFYGVYDLEYVPILDLQNKKNSFESIFDGDNFIPNITLKNVEVTSLYRAFNNTYNLKKIKTNNLVVNATSVSSAFYNSGIEDISSLNIDWTNVSNAFNFLAYCKNIKNMVLDTRTAIGLKVIGCYGDTTHFMSGFKGLRVSDQAPFDYTTAPQINVSYTGMDRSALVQLFNDLPYNVGYTVTGSPTINNGVVSDFSKTKYLTIDKNFGTTNPWEIVCDFTTGNDISGNQAIIGTDNSCVPFIITPDGVISAFLSSTGASWNIISEPIINTIEPNTRYFMRCEFTGLEYNWYLYENNDWVLKKNINSSLKIYSSNVMRIGYNNGTSTYFKGSIDLNNTYIKINDVYWFRGQPAMTKTINVVGCTGTSSLTADDRAIVTDKGWSITHQ